MAKMKNCVVCGEEMASNAKACPKCGAKNTKPIFKRVWFWLIILVLLIGGLGMAGDDSDKKPSASGAVNEEKDNKNKFGDFELVGELEATTDELGFMVINGSIKNTSDEDKEFCDVEFYVYDADGNTLDSAYDCVTGIKAGGTWKFSASCLDEGAVSWELKEISGH